MPTAHPRSCGENLGIHAYDAEGKGSSPLMRGKQNMTQATRWRLGLIPAHAGKTAIAIFALCMTGAHPRSCGENVTIKATAGPEVGSSPLMRGKPRP